MCSWDTTEEDVDAFAAAVEEVVGSPVPSCRCRRTSPTTFEVYVNGVHAAARASTTASRARALRVRARAAQGGPARPLALVPRRVGHRHLPAERLGRRALRGRRASAGGRGPGHRTRAERRLNGRGAGDPRLDMSFDASSDDLARRGRAHTRLRELLDARGPAVPAPARARAARRRRRRPAVRRARRARAPRRRARPPRRPRRVRPLGAQRRQRGRPGAARLRRGPAAPPRASRARATLRSSAVCFASHGRMSFSAARIARVAGERFSV